MAGNKDNNKKEVTTMTTTTKKKEFNKREWREKKYSKKTALDSWKNQKEKKLQRNYFKLLKKESSRKNRQKGTARFNDDDENPNLMTLGDQGKMAELVLKEQQDQENSCTSIYPT